MPSRLPNPLETMLDYQRAARHYPGAVLLLERDGVAVARLVSGVLHGYSGDSPPAAATPISDQTRFRVASLTKGMVSMVALMLVERGVLALDTPIGDILPELAQMVLANGDSPRTAPTLRHALSHTAGYGNLGEITDPTIRAQCAQAPLEDKLALMTREHFLQTLAARPLTAEPGSRFQYGYSTDVVGQIIERVTGQSLFEAMNRSLFAPLGMTKTNFRVAPSEHAQMPHAFDEDTAWHAFVARFESADTQADEQQVAESELRGPIHSGGGGLVSTLDDVAAYARMLANGGVVAGHQFLSEPLFAQTMSNQLGPTVPGPYNFTGGGFGFGLAGAIRNDWAPAAIPSKAGEFAWSGVTGHTLYVGPGEGWFALMLSSNTASRTITRFEFRRAVEMVDKNG